MSNARKLAQAVPAGIAATARAARCSDCTGKARARWRGGEWEIKLWHAASCPAYTGSLRETLHKDAEASVQRAAKATGSELVYEVVSGESGVITGSGLVTAPGQG
jgi:hypothetical protein